MIKVLGVETANAFFNAVGAARRDLRRITLIQHTWEFDTLPLDVISKFFLVIDEAQTLRQFHIHGMGKDLTKLSENSVYQRLLEKLGNVEVQVTGQF